MKFTKAYLRVLCVFAAAFGLALLAGRAALAQPGDVSPAAPAANPVINVAHFAPFGTDVLSTSVTVRVNGTDVFTDFVYGEVVEGVDVLPAGVYTIEVLPTGSATVAISGVAELEEDKQYTLAAIGDGSNRPLALKVLEDSPAAPPAGSANLRIAHFAPFAATLEGTEVDICSDESGTALPGLTNVPFGVASTWLALPAGIYDLSIALAGSNCSGTALDVPPLALVAGKTYDVYAIGKNDAAFPLDVTSITGLDFPAQVTVGHFAPFAPNVAGTAVDIRVNGSPAFTDVVYGNFVPNVALLPGATLVEVLPAGTATVALSTTANLESGAAYNLFAIGGANSQPLAFSTSEISKTAPAGKAVVTIGHLAPFAANVNDTAVDICTDAGVAVQGLTGIEYPQVAANLVLDPGRYDLKIAVAGTNCGTTALDLPRFYLFAGEIADVFAIGLNDTAFPLEAVSTTGLNTAEWFLPAIFD
jgi:hypothetical protein